MEDVILNITLIDEDNITKKEVNAKKDIYNNYIKYQFNENNNHTTYKIFKDSIEIINDNNETTVQLLLSKRISSKAKVIFKNQTLPLKIKLIKYEILENIEYKIEYKIEYLLEENKHLILIKEK